MTSPLYRPSDRPATRPRSRIGFAACVALVVATAFLSLYISAAIFLTVALTSLINVVGLAAAITVWVLPWKWMRIAALALLGAIVALQFGLGFDLLAFALLSIVGAMALTRFRASWLYIATGLITLTTGWSGITLALNRNLVPQLFTEMVPALDLNMPPLLASYTITIVALVFLGIGAWRLALLVDVFAIALFIAAAAHLVGAVLSFYALSVPMLLAEVFPTVYEFHEDSYAMMNSAISMVSMRAKDVIIGVLFPLALGIAGLVRIARQPRFALRGTPTMSASPVVAALTAVALLLPASGLLFLAFLSDLNPLQLFLPWVIDLGGLLLWIVAVIAWMLHTAPARAEYVPGGDLARTDLVVTLVLAATPLILPVLDIGFAFIP